MGARFLHNKTAVITVSIVLLVGLIGLLAPVIAPNDPYATDILTNSPITACNTRSARISWDGVCSRV